MKARWPHRLTLVGAGLSAALLLAACGGAEPTATPQPTVPPWGQPSAASFNKERGTRIHIKFLGDRGRTPWVLWTRYEPNHVQPAHSHDEDEVIYVMEGEVAVGEARCGPGTAIFVEKDTTYGPLVAGPQGVVFLRATPQGVQWPG